uniref:Growth hormone-inducible transmembrane protein n=1 Tax=Cacopsylla melanoneura TaxID=428564 RepID=A0A8D8XMY6_9HEMI
MMILKLCGRSYLTPMVKTGGSILSKPAVASPRVNLVRSFNDNARSKFRTAEQRRKTLTETVMKPAGESAFKIGQGAVAGGAALGLGALCYYGLGLSSERGAVDYASLWPQYVRDRIKATYAYFGGSIMISAASAYAVFTSPSILRLVSGNSMLAMFGTIALLMGSGMLVQSIEYKSGVGAKQLAWAVHSALVGAVIAPICFIGGPVLVRAAWYTAGIVGGLSTVAACAPSDKFLTMGGPLAIGLGVVFASSIGSAFLPATTALGAGLASVSLYGGLLLFSGFLLYDTQKIIARAERTPQYQVYDPVNASLHIYMDTINIFIRLVTIFSGGNRRK